jgi:hypothetical protein
MWRLIGLVCTSACLLFSLVAQNERFTKYKAVEAYEVHPGILIMPKYTTDNEICQIVVEKDLYSDGTVHLDPALPHDLVTEIVDELAPPNERGPLTTDEKVGWLSLYAGNTVTSFGDYRNVSIAISRSSSSVGDIVAVIKWKNRTCK